MPNRVGMRTGYSIDWDSVNLGKEPDGAIAARLGVHRRTVCKERNARGIRKFGGLYLTQEDQPCRSIFEAMYDACLHDQGIVHLHEIKVDWMIADFLVGDTYHEVAGMMAYDRYARKHEQKIKRYRELGLKVRWLYPDEIHQLFASCKTPLRFEVDRICEDCGKSTMDLVKKVCRICYMRRWHTGEPNAACKTCETPFYSDSGRKFCSHDCYSKSLCSTKWPEWHVVTSMLLSMSRRDIAAKLGVSRGALDQHIHRNKKRSLSHQK